MDVPASTRRKNKHKIGNEMRSEYNLVYAYLCPPGKSNPAWKHTFVCAVIFWNNLSYLIKNMPPCISKIKDLVLEAYNPFKEVLLI